MDGRMDRVEVALERLVGIVSSVVDRQVVFQDQLISLAEIQKRSEEAHKRAEEAHKRTEEAQQRNEEAINVLIRMMDEWIRHNPRS